MLRFGMCARRIRCGASSGNDGSTRRLGRSNGLDRRGHRVGNFRHNPAGNLRRHILGGLGHLGCQRLGHRFGFGLGLVKPQEHVVVHGLARQRGNCGLRRTQASLGRIFLVRRSRRLGSLGIRDALRLLGEIVRVGLFLRGGLVRCDIVVVGKRSARGNNARRTRRTLAMHDRSSLRRNRGGGLFFRRARHARMGCVFGRGSAVDAAQDLEHHGDARCVVVRALVERREPTQGDEHHGNGQQDEGDHAQKREQRAYHAQASREHDVTQQDEEGRRDDGNGCRLR